MSQSGYLYTTSDLEKAFPLQLVDQFCAPVVYLEGQNVQSFQNSANVLVQKLFCFDMTEFQSLTSGVIHGMLTDISVLPDLQDPGARHGGVITFSHDASFESQTPACCVIGSIL